MDTEKIKQTQLILKLVFTIVPIVAGLDKFTNLLVDWTMYLPQALNVLPISGQALMYIVGVIEIIAGVLVFMRPRIGAYVVMAWLIAIAMALILAGYYDIAVRDLAMAAGAYTLATLTAATEE